MMNLDNFMKIGMGQKMKGAGAGISQYTVHLKPCLGVGIYNLDTNESYMGHYTDLMFFNFEEDVREVKRDFGNSNLEIFTAGASLDRDNIDLTVSVIQDKKYIEKIINKYFPDSNTSFNWSDFGEVADLYLDKGIKKFILNKVPARKNF